jgi:hypothetical protein
MDAKGNVALHAGESAEPAVCLGPMAHVPAATRRQARMELQLAQLERHHARREAALLARIQQQEDRMKDMEDRFRLQLADLHAQLAKTESILLEQVLLHPVLLVEGAGEELVNGHYAADSDYNGHSQFYKLNDDGTPFMVDGGRVNIYFHRCGWGGWGIGVRASTKKTWKRKKKNKKKNKKENRGTLKSRRTQTDMKLR